MRTATFISSLPLLALFTASLILSSCEQKTPQQQTPAVKNSDFWKLKEAGKIDYEKTYFLKNMLYEGVTQVVPGPPGWGLCFQFYDVVNRESLGLDINDDKLRSLTKGAYYNITFKPGVFYSSKLIKAERIWGD